MNNIQEFRKRLVDTNHPTSYSTYDDAIESGTHVRKSSSDELDEEEKSLLINQIIHNANGDQTMSESKEGLKVGYLYCFNPCKKLPHLCLKPKMNNEIKSPSINRAKDNNDEKNYINESSNSSSNNLTYYVRRKSILLVLAKHGAYRKIVTGSYEGWIILSENYYSDEDLFQPRKFYYRYEDWQGNNVFFFNGMLMLGCDANFFLMTFITLVSLTISCYFTMQDVYENMTGRDTTIQVKKVTCFIIH